MKAHGFLDHQPKRGGSGQAGDTATIQPRKLFCGELDRQWMR
jgi:hypothetical protein